MQPFASQRQRVGLQDPSRLNIIVYILAMNKITVSKCLVLAEFISVLYDFRTCLVREVLRRLTLGPTFSTTLYSLRVTVVK